MKITIEWRFLLGNLRRKIYKRTKSYKQWIQDAAHTASCDAWMKTGANPCSDEHKAMMEEIFKLPSYKQWWRLKEDYPLYLLETAKKNIKPKKQTN